MDPTAKLIMLAAYLGTGILMGGLGVPLWLEMIPPNPWYGFRTPSALANEKIWYPVNRVTGYWLIITGVACSGTSICAYLANLGVDTTTWVNLAVLATGIVLMIVQPVRLLLRLKAKLGSS
jgi:hypothetical protein